MPKADVALVATVIAASESCASILPDILFESLEIVALRLYERLLRRLFLGLSDPSTSIALFLDLTVLSPGFLICMRCAFVSVACRLRCAASAAFCAR
jgi:hypothetical protein